MKKTIRNAVLAAMVLTTVCGGAQMAWAADVLSNVKGAGTYLDDTAALGKDAVITATGSQNKNINITGENDTTFSVLAYVGGQITLGDQNTQNVNISTTGTNAYGLMAMHENVVPGGVGKGSHITVYGDTLNINVHGTEYAIGMQAQNNSWSPNKATIDINTKNTVINASTDEDHVDAGGEHTAIGIVAYSGSTVNIKNNLTVNAATSISTRGKSNVIINKDGKGTVKLNGDISFDYDDKTSGTVIDSNLNINLANADSYLNGNIVKHGDAPETKAGVSGMALALSNGATWTSTENSFVNNLTLKNGGTVNLAGDAQTVDVLTKMSSDNGVVATNSLGNKVKVEEKANHIKSLTVKGTGAMADAIAKDSSVAKKLANVVTDASGKSAATNVTTDEGEVAGAYSGTVDANGNLSGSLAKNSTNENISGLGVISLMTWRQENNDLNKRLGELRDSKGQYGLWTRMSRGEAKYNDLGIKNQYNYYQLGYDARISDDWILGGAVSYTDGESSFRDGDGTNKHTGFAVYGSRLADDGSFIDIIAKYAHMKNEYDTYAGAGDGDYSTNGFAFSAEYGKRFKGQNDFWI